MYSFVTSSNVLSIVSTRLVLTFKLFLVLSFVVSFVVNLYVPVINVTLRSSHCYN